MVQQEKLPSMFAGSAGVELKSERRSFAKFTEKHLSWSLLLNKAADWRPANLLKMETPALLFSYKFCKNFKNTYFIERLHTFTTVLFIIFE